MGIQGLMKLLADECPDAISEINLNSYMGRKVAVDASMAIYAFLISVRSSGPEGGSQMLMNEAGEVTSHIQGMFNRTIRMLSCGIKPIFVFDGKPPQMKSGELLKRSHRRKQAEEELKKAKEEENKDDIEKYSKRIVRATRQHSEDCKKLLRLMGCPIVEAPGEAEAQCAQLAREGVVWATATEDMDALTFQTPRLLRRLTFAGGSGNDAPVLEINLSKILEGLSLSQDEFVDLCILCGCDYCSSIKGIGPKTAYKLISDHRTLENVVEFLSNTRKKNKYDIGSDWRTTYKRNKILKDEEEEKEVVENDKKEEETVQDEIKEEKDGTEEKIEKVEEEEKKVVVEENNEEKETEEQVQQQSQEEESALSTPTSSSTLIDSSNDQPSSQSQSESDVGVSPLDKMVIEEEEEGDQQLEKEMKEKEDIPKEDEKKEMMEEEVVENEFKGLEAENEDEEEEKIEVPPLFTEARRLFKTPDVLPSSSFELKWTGCDEPNLIHFLVEEMGFEEGRVRGRISSLKKAKSKSNQKRMDSFFGATKVVSSSSSSTSSNKSQKRGRKNSTSSKNNKKQRRR